MTGGRRQKGRLVWEGAIRRRSTCNRESGLPSALMLPQHLAVATLAREHACQHEQQVGKPVEITRRFLAHRFVTRERDGVAFGATTDGARDVALRRGHAAA